MTTTEQAQATFISSEAFLAHWQGHRGLTRKMIVAFPEDKLFTYSVGGMRPFGALVIEMLGMGGEGVQGIVTGKFPTWEESEKKYHVTTKEDLLDRWDKVTEQINTYWAQIPPQRFNETGKVFGQWEDKIHKLILYFIDNEIHHRGQGYVYLRSLDIAPPAFWDR